MKNPNGPYPGRQLFLGMTADKKPAFAYLVTGRSPASRERFAKPMGDSIIMGPTGNAPYDPLRHYTAVKYDNSIGLVAFSNGIQTEAIYEIYRLLYNVKTKPAAAYIKKVMEGANYEADSLHTPRISAVICNDVMGKPAYFASIKTDNKLTPVWKVTPKAGMFYGVSTYHGNMENPGAYNIDKGLTELKFDAKTPQEIAGFIYDISAMDYQGDDIRVCAVGGVREDNTWKTAIINRHKG